METDEREFEKLLAEAEATPFGGWDFSYLAGRMVEGEPPWRYEELVQARMAGADAVLDLGTGGGELLASLLTAASPRPARVVATEAWPPNVEVARRRLEPLGVEVVAVDPAPDNVDIEPGSGAGSLPFPDRSFSLVIDRHESYFPAEVARILEAGGTFLTQQVGSRYLDGLSGWFGIADESTAGWDRGFAVAQLEEAGLAVARQEEDFPDVAFRDVGALVYYLRAVPWQLPGFTVEAHRDALRSVHEHIRSTGTLRLRGHFFLIEAKRS